MGGARDARLRRSVAVKVLTGTVAHDPRFRERFDREARAIAALNHPNICTLFDIGQQDGIAFLVMELLDGATLAARIARGPVPNAEVLSIATQIGEALDAAHRAGIVHRDLKPGNIMLAKPGTGSAGSSQARLLDFGLARPVSPTDGIETTQAALTAHGDVVGTLPSMAPEQREGRQVDARTDIWAFGCVPVRDGVQAPRLHGLQRRTVDQRDPDDRVSAVDVKPARSSHPEVPRQGSRSALANRRVSDGRITLDWRAVRGNCGAGARRARGGAATRARVALVPTGRGRPGTDGRRNRRGLFPACRA